MSGRPFVITTGNVQSVFDTLSKLTEGMAQHAGLLIDIELLWIMSGEEAAAIELAKKANAGKNLRWSDRRTRGWKLYEAHRAAFFAKYQ